MLKKLIQGSLQQFGYRLAPVLREREPPNPRFDRDDLDVALKVIARHVSRNGGSMTWERSKRYLDSRRVNLYLAVLDRLESAGVLKEGTTVLDVGVYFGYLLRVMHKYHPAAIYTGTETHDTRLAIARELCPFASITHGTIDGLPGDSQYDLVMLTEVLEHLVHPETALQKLAKVGRTLLLTVPDGRRDTTEAMQFNPEWDSYRGHVNFWSPESWPVWLQRELPNHAIRAGHLTTRKLYAIAEPKDPA